MVVDREQFGVCKVGIVKQVLIGRGKDMSWAILFEWDSVFEVIAQLCHW